MSVYKTVRKIAAARLTGTKKLLQISGLPSPELAQYSQTLA